MWGGVSVLMAVQPVRRLSHLLRHRDNRPFLTTTGMSTGVWGPHSSDPLPNLSPSRTVPEAGEDAGGCVTSRTSHTEVFQ